jgi:hypothetical protein
MASTDKPSRPTPTPGLKHAEGLWLDPRRVGVEPSFATLNWINAMRSQRRLVRLSLARCRQLDRRKILANDGRLSERLCRCASPRFSCHAQPGVEPEQERGQRLGRASSGLVDDWAAWRAGDGWVARERACFGPRRSRAAAAWRTPAAAGESAGKKSALLDLSHFGNGRGVFGFRAWRSDKWLYFRTHSTRCRALSRL